MDWAYEIELAGEFDVVCYFDGFGIGSDADQRRLLHRIAGWRAPGSCVLYLAKLAPVS